jgi:hypothetical protein
MDVIKKPILQPVTLLVELPWLILETKYMFVAYLICY